MRLLLAPVLAAILFASGCGGQAAEAGKVADLDFAGTTLAGTTFAGSSLAGKSTVLWFWAPWCPTCLAQSGNVSRLARQYDGSVQVIGVAGLATEEFIEDLAGQISGITHLVDLEGDLWKHFGVQAQSTYTVIDARGQIRAEGFLDDSELNELVADVAAER